MSKSITDADGVDVRKDVVYATHDGVALAGDLYLPLGAGPFPALVAVHVAGAAICTAATAALWASMRERAEPQPVQG